MTQPIEPAPMRGLSPAVAATSVSPAAAPAPGNPALSPPPGAFPTTFPPTPERVDQIFAQGTGGRGGQFPELDPELRKAIFDRFYGIPTFFPKTLGFRLVDARRGYSRLQVVNTPALCQPAMVMHGGASFGLADTAIAFALMSIVPPTAIYLTVEMSISYLEAIPVGAEVTAEAWILRSTRRSAYAEVDIWVGDKLSARATSNYAIRDPKPPAGVPASGGAA